MGASCQFLKSVRHPTMHPESQVLPILANFDDLIDPFVIWEFEVVLLGYFRGDKTTTDEMSTVEVFDEWFRRC